MKSYTLVHQLISLVEVIEKESDREVSLADFAGYLVEHIGSFDTQQGHSESRFGEKEKPAIDLAFNIDNNISRLFFFMSRYAKLYIKKALEGSPLQSTEDFTCLAILMTHESISKTELIRYNIQEKTSGTVVINRLKQFGLIREFKNESDRREKLVAITIEGKSLLYQLFEHTSHVGKIITGELNLEEKLVLQRLLQKLEDFHSPIYNMKKVKSKQDLKVLADNL